MGLPSPEQNGLRSEAFRGPIEPATCCAPDDVLLGELDILPLGDMDLSCAAMAQGPTRLARGFAWAKYVNERLGAQHRTIIVPLCGHNARCMLTANLAVPLIFPKQ
jgi:hypothetical protein